VEVLTGEGSSEKGEAQSGSYSRQGWCIERKTSQTMSSNRKEKNIVLLKVREEGEGTGTYRNSTGREMALFMADSNSETEHATQPRGSRET